MRTTWLAVLLGIGVAYWAAGEAVATNSNRRIPGIPVLIEEGENIVLVQTNTIEAAIVPRSWNTNGYTAVTNECAEFDPIIYMSEHGILTNTIQRLVKEGYVCGVVGHKSSEVAPRFTLVDLPDGVIEWHYRCVLCGKDAFFVEKRAVPSVTFPTYPTPTLFPMGPVYK